MTSSEIYLDDLINWQLLKCNERNNKDYDPDKGKILQKQKYKIVFIN